MASSRSEVKTPKGTYIVRKAKKMLMNERVRAINNMFNCQIDTCINNLERLLEREVLEECHRFIDILRPKKGKLTNSIDCGNKTQVATQTYNMAAMGK